MPVRKYTLCMVLGFLLFFQPWHTLAAGRPFDFNERCRQAYSYLMMLKLDEGLKLLDQEKQEHPENLAPYFLDNYADFFRMFFHEDAAEYAKLKNNRDIRLNLMAQGDKQSPFYLYTQAMLHFQWAASRIKFGERWSAVWEFRRAYLLMKENNDKFPHFTPNKMLLGAMQTVIGTVPESYRWITSILGLSGGSISRGMQLLQSYVNDGSEQGTLFKEEAYFYYAYLKFYIEHKPDEVFRFIQEKNLDLVNNKLNAFMAANLAINNHMGDYGLKILNNMKSGPAYLDMPIIDYEMGVLKLNHLELGDATHYLKSFLDRFKGKFYVKDALLKLSRAYYLQGNRPLAEKYLAEIQSRGNAETDADKVALREMKKKQWPNATILSARFLSDGGYFEEALHILTAQKVENFPDPLDKIEYAYFLARIYDELEQDDHAIPLYEVTIKVASSRPEYFAARAAMQLGFIYEQRKDTARAIEYFKKCISMPEEEYKSTLDQRAKAGINRLTVK